MASPLPFRTTSRCRVYSGRGQVVRPARQHLRQRHLCCEDLRIATRVPNADEPSRHRAARIDHLLAPTGIDGPPLIAGYAASQAMLLLRGGTRAPVRWGLCRVHRSDRSLRHSAPLRTATPFLIQPHAGSGPLREVATRAVLPRHGDPRVAAPSEPIPSIGACSRPGRKASACRRPSEDSIYIPELRNE
jgi:hypothetical protein